MNQELIINIGIMFITVVTGGFLVQLLTKKNGLKLLLAFSGGFLLTIIFTHILPETYASDFKNSGYYILIGFLIQLCLEYFSGGAEHGHMHNHSKGKFPLVVFLSLTIHSVLEAIPLVHEGHSHIHDLYWGVIIHKLPIAIVLMTIFKSQKMSLTSSWIFLLVFALTGPLGMVLGQFVGHQHEAYLSYVLLIAIGMFLHISTTIIFESNEGHKLNIYKFLAILSGFAVGMFMN